MLFSKKSKRVLSCIFLTGNIFALSTQCQVGAVLNRQLSQRAAQVFTAPAISRDDIIAIEKLALEEVQNATNEIDHLEAQVIVAWAKDMLSPSETTWKGLDSCIKLFLKKGETASSESHIRINQILLQKIFNLLRTGSNNENEKILRQIAADYKAVAGSFSNFEGVSDYMKYFWKDAVEGRPVYKLSYLSELVQATLAQIGFRDPKYFQLSSVYKLEGSRLCDKEAKILWEPQVHAPTSKENLLNKITVVNKASIAATREAMQEYGPNKRYCLVNFANAFTPGGGVLEGATAQEENLCGRSSLWAHLKSKQGIFYDENNREFPEPADDDIKAKKPEALMALLKRNLFKNEGIYSKDVEQVREDIDFKSELKQGRNLINSFLPREQRAKFDVISIAAPNLSDKTQPRDPKGFYPRIPTEILSEEQEAKLMEERARLIINMAVKNNVNVLSLGAIGCGVFKVNPAICARAFYKILIEEGYASNFDKVIFPILVQSNDHPNLVEFKKTFNKI